jgi:hypothetical protein
MSSGVLDTFPIHVNAPQSSFGKRLLYNPKYAGHVLKVQLVSDLLGRYLFLSGPHLGVTHDSKIWEQSKDRHPMHPREVILADGAYIGNLQLLTPARQPQNGHLQVDDYMFNTILGFYRSRAEHGNCRFTRHAIFQTKYRGSWDHLCDVIHAIGHTQAVDNRLYLKYEPYGPWDHF